MKKIVIAALVALAIPASASAQTKAELDLVGAGPGGDVAGIEVGSDGAPLPPAHVVPARETQVPKPDAEELRSARLLFDSMVRDNIADAREYLGSPCVGAGDLGSLEPVCRDGVVEQAVDPRDGTTIQEYKDGLIISENATVPYGPQVCSGDNRFTYAPTVPQMTKGLIYHAWMFRVNMTQFNTARWVSDGGAQTYNAGERGAFEFAAASQDVMAMRSPTSGATPGRYDGNTQFTGCVFTWPQGGDLSGNTAFNQGRIRYQYLGDTSRRASLLPNCRIGDPNTSYGQLGVPDGENTVTAGDWHHIQVPGGWCDDAVAVTAIYVHSSGFITEADISVNTGAGEFSNGQDIPWCYRFTRGCVGKPTLASNLAWQPMEDTARHELMHVGGLGHTCGEGIFCYQLNPGFPSANLMSLDVGSSAGTYWSNWEAWPQDIAEGDRNGWVWLYTVN